MADEPGFLKAFWKGVKADFLSANDPLAYDFLVQNAKAGDYEYIQTAKVAKLEYAKAPNGEKVLVMAHIVVPNYRLLKDGDRYRDEAGDVHVHRGENAIIRDWPNRTESYDFRNVSACVTFLKRLEAKRSDIEKAGKPGLVDVPIKFGVTDAGERMTALLLKRAAETVAIAQGLDRVFLGKGYPKSMREALVEKDTVTYKGKSYARIYDNYVPSDSPRLKGMPFRESLSLRMEDDRLVMLDAMRRGWRNVPGGEIERVSRVAQRMEGTMAGDYLKTKETALAYALHETKKEPLAEKPGERKKVALRR